MVKVELAAVAGASEMVLVVHTLTVKLVLLADLR